MHVQDEFTRQRELDAYRIVDTLPQAAYDDIVRLAAHLCGAPVALVSLLDRERQWFKARAGFEHTETERRIAFREHAIRAPGRRLEVADAANDPRFRDNPLVAGPHGVRFYAGMPLVTPEGAALGTLCVLDRTPLAMPIDLDAVLKALAHPLRRQMLHWLQEPERHFPAQTHPFEIGVCAGQFDRRSGLSQSTVSAHLATLQRAGLVSRHRIGQWHFFRRDEATIAAFLHQLGETL